MMKMKEFNLESVDDLCYYHVEFYSSGYKKSKSYDKVYVTLQTDFEMNGVFSNDEFVNSSFLQFGQSDFLYSFNLTMGLKGSSLYCLDSCPFYYSGMCTQFWFMMTFLSIEDGYLTHSWPASSVQSQSIIKYYLPKGGKFFNKGNIFMFQSGISEMFNFFSTIGLWFVCLSLGGNHLFFSTYFKLKNDIEVSEPLLGLESDIFDHGVSGPDFVCKDGSLEDLNTFPLSVSSGGVGSIKSPSSSGSGSFLFIDFFFYNISKCSSMLAMYGDLVKEDSLMMGIMICFETSQGFVKYFKSLEDEMSVTNFFNCGTDLMMNKMMVAEVSKTATTRKVFKWESCSKYFSSMDPYEMSVSK